jgi:hypothetical protein
MLPAVSTQTHQDGGQRTGQQANRSRYELEKAGNRTQWRREADQLGTSTAPQIQFILTELSTGLTLSTLAGERQGAAKTRIRIKARAAYDSALRFSDRLALTEEESHKIRTGLGALKKSLEALGKLSQRKPVCESRPCDQLCPCGGTKAIVQMAKARNLGTIVPVRARAIMLPLQDMRSSGHRETVLGAFGRRRLRDDSSPAHLA